MLRVHVVEAKELMKKDISVLGKGKSDPYAVINVGAQEFRTKTINNTVAPKWDYWCEVCALFLQFEWFIFIYNIRCSLKFKSSQIFVIFLIIRSVLSTKFSSFCG